LQAAPFEFEINPFMSDLKSPRISILYCRQCRWMMRAAWLAQELLTTFSEEIGEVALQPGTGGILEIRVDEKLVFSRKEVGRFPEAKEVKQLVRDAIAPDRNLGHSDRSDEERLES
jgi:selenoprotein W-related protein